MAGINEGDILEGLFAVAIALLVADGRIEKNKMIRLKNQIDSQYFGKGEQRIPITEKVQAPFPNRPSDTIDTFANINFRFDVSARDREINMYYTRMRDVGNLSDKIDSLISQANPFGSVATRKLLKIREDLLNNDKGENVSVDVFTDGSENRTVESGMIQGEVNIRIDTTVDDQTQTVFSEAIPFSVRTEQPSENELSAYEAMTYMAEQFGLQWRDIDKYDYLKQKAISQPEKSKKYDIIMEMYNDLQRMFTSVRGNVTEKIIDFLEEQFNTNNGFVEVDKSVFRDLKDMSTEDLGNQFKMRIVPKGEILAIIDNTSQRTLFELRLKVERAKDFKTTFVLKSGIGLSKAVRK